MFSVVFLFTGVPIPWCTRIKQCKESPSYWREGSSRKEAHRGGPRSCSGPLRYIGDPLPSAKVVFGTPLPPDRRNWNGMLRNVNGRLAYCPTLWAKLELIITSWKNTSTRHAILFLKHQMRWFSEPPVKFVCPFKFSGSHWSMFTSFTQQITHSCSFTWKNLWEQAKSISMLLFLHFAFWLLFHIFLGNNFNKTAETRTEHT